LSGCSSRTSRRTLKIFSNLSDAVFKRQHREKREKIVINTPSRREGGCSSSPVIRSASHKAPIYFFTFFKNRGVKKRGVQRRRKEKKNVQVVRGEESLYIFLEEGSLDPHLDE